MNLSITSKISGDNLVFRLRAGGEAVTAGRSLHIGILLDNSGSMGGERLAAVKRTLHAARSLFQMGDRITLVTFSDTADIRLRAHVLSDVAAIDAAYQEIDQISADASTNLGAGLEALYSVTTAYDAVILLTDGMVNAGITSTAGLRAMAQAAGTTLAFNTLGYGATHNRALLRELSVQSRGTYTYVDSDEILALAMGDILSGLRAEVVRGVRLRLSSGAAGWSCQEAGSVADSQEYYVGHMIPDRDYWVVFRSATGGATIAGGAGVLTATVTATEQDALTVTVPSGEMLDEDITDQVLRAEVASALMTVSTQLEGGVAAPDMTRLRTLQTRLEALPARPLLMRLRAQVAELLELAARVTSVSPSLHHSPGLTGNDAHLRTHLMARMSSGATCLANQRGVYSMAGADDTNTSFFSSPLQQTASSVVRHVSQMPRVTTPVLEADDDEDAPNEPVVSDSHASVHPSRLEPEGPLGVQQTPMEDID